MMLCQVMEVDANDQLRQSKCPEKNTYSKIANMQRLEKNCSKMDTEL